MVFQWYALYPHLSVRDNLAFGLKLREGSARARSTTRIKRGERDAGPRDAARPAARSSSREDSGSGSPWGGPSCAAPNIFLFDEPLSNLDAALRAEVRVEIRRLHDRLGATTLYVTHDQVEAMTLADTLWVMNGGEVEQKGAPLEVYERPRTRFVATFLGSPQMNLVDAAVAAQRRRTWLAEGGGARRGRRRRTLRRRARAGAAVTVGVRPHDFAVAPEAASPAATLKVELVEALGFEAFAYGRLAPGGPRIVARLDAADATPCSDGRRAPSPGGPRARASLRPGARARRSTREVGRGSRLLFCLVRRWQPCSSRHPRARSRRRSSSGTRTEAAKSAPS